MRKDPHGWLQGVSGVLGDEAENRSCGERAGTGGSLSKYRDIIVNITGGFTSWPCIDGLDRGRDRRQSGQL